MLVRINNPPNRFISSRLEWLDEIPFQSTQVYEEQTRKIISENDSPDVGFRYSLNPYRGCHHGCAYCYARPTHQYLDFGAGSDFETKIVAKVNAPSRLREEFMNKKWRGDLLLFSGVTDCYQPLEANYELTRKCLMVCNDFCNPAGIITKSSLIQRDIDLLKSLHVNAGVRVYFSIAFSDEVMARKIEPYAPSPKARWRAMEALAKAGIPVSVGLAPVIPALNESQIPEILKKSKENGADTAFMTLLRLQHEVKEVFLGNIQKNFPSSVTKVINRIKAMRNNSLYQSDFGRRMKGEGQEWEVVEFLFNKHCEELGLNRNCNGVNRSTFRRPQRQLGLF